MLKQGFSQTVVARTIGKHKSVVSREITRNCDQRNGAYHHDQAHRKCITRLFSKPKKRRFTPEVQTYVTGLLQEQYSPEQIEGAAKLQEHSCVSHERIYQYVWKDKKQGGVLYLQLRTEGKRYRKRGAAKDRRGCIVGRVGIAERPAVVEERLRIGDLEIDTVIGKNQQGAIVTTRDRASGMLKMIKVASRDSKILAKETIHALQSWKPYLKTMTSDNGKEVALHRTISDKLNLDFYFAEPYHSWERGSNENLNGLIRQYFPKKTDFSTITKTQIKYVELKLNNRPRKRFGFHTNEIFNQLIKNQEVALVA